MRNKIDDLRNHLFAAMERISEAESPEELQKELDKAKALSEVGSVIVESAKVEVQYLNKAGLQAESDFLSGLNSPKQLTN